MHIKLRNIQEGDISEIISLANSCLHVEDHSPFVYWMLSKYFNNITFVAINGADNSIVGFVSGVIASNSRKIGYIWQVAVDPTKRRIGIGTKLITKIITELQSQQLKGVEFSIDPVNYASKKMILSTFEMLGLIVEEKDKFSIHIEEIDWAESHQHFLVEFK